jgi:SAM-dependent methyltransferase
MTPEKLDRHSAHGNELERIPRYVEGQSENAAGIKAAAAQDPRPPLIRNANSRYVQYGSSWIAPEEWENFDASITLKWERIPVLGRYTKNASRFPSYVRPGDIVKGLPIPSASCQGVYASHVLEHLSLEDFHKALENTRRILRKNGIFRALVPDLEFAAREYIAGLDRGEPAANESFLRGAGLGCEQKKPGLMGLAHKLFNTSAHLWMWDEASLAQALKDHGFSRIRPCRFGDCEDPMFSFVENRGRFDHAVALEARG